PLLCNVSKSTSNGFGIKLYSVKGDRAEYSPSKYLYRYANKMNFSSISFASELFCINETSGAFTGGFFISKISSISKPFSPYDLARSILIQQTSISLFVHINKSLLLSSL